MYLSLLNVKSGWAHSRAAPADYFLTLIHPEHLCEGIECQDWECAPAEDRLSMGKSADQSEEVRIVNKPEDSEYEDHAVRDSSGSHFDREENISKGGSYQV